MRNLGNVMILSATLLSPNHTTSNPVLEWTTKQTDKNKCCDQMESLYKLIRAFILRTRYFVSFDMRSQINLARKNERHLDR